MKRTTRILLFAALGVLGAAFVLIGAFSGQALAVLAMSEGVKVD